MKKRARRGIDRASITMKARIIRMVVRKIAPDEEIQARIIRPRAPVVKFDFGSIKSSIKSTASLNTSPRIYGWLKI